MKNIAAEHAFKDGCDYIVWHDIDMIPESNVNYAFPDKNPIHFQTSFQNIEMAIIS